jgi:hypothetical protein
MNLLRKALVPFMGVAVIALVLLVAAPRTAHAVVATLVSVVNTVPIVVAPSAPLLYESNCTGAFGGSQEATCDFQAVPAGNTLFIDAVSILGFWESGLAPQHTRVLTYNTGASYPEGQGTAGGGTQGVALYVPMMRAGTDFLDNYVGTLTNASVWTASSPVPKCQVLLNGTSSVGVTSCTIWGHLAPIPGGGS